MYTTSNSSPTCIARRTWVEIRGKAAVTTWNTEKARATANNARGQFSASRCSPF